MALIFGGDLDKVWDNTATAQSGGQAPHELGAIARVPRQDGEGDKYYVFVHNDTGVAIDQGKLAAIVSAGGWSVEAAAGTVDQNAALFAGVVQRSGGLPADHYGWVQCWGRGVVKADAGGAALGDQLVSSATAGEFDVAAAGVKPVLAIARAVIGASSVGAADICIRTA